jgi:hypothetical protein
MLPSWEMALPNQRRQRCQVDREPAQERELAGALELAR